MDFKIKSETLAVENKKLSESIVKNKNKTGKIKDNKKINTEQENIKLKDEIKKLRKENDDLTNIIKKEKADLEFPTKPIVEDKDNTENFNTSQPEIYNKLKLGNSHELERNGNYFN